MNHLIVYANEMALVEECKLIVNELSKGYGLLSYRFKWLPADKIPAVIIIYTEGMNE